MKKRLCIAVLLSVAGLQAADKGTKVKTLAGQFGGAKVAKSASPETIEPRAIQLWTDKQIKAEKGYITEPDHVKVMLASAKQFTTPTMRALAETATIATAGALIQQLQDYLNKSHNQKEAFLKAFNMQISRLATLLDKINQEHGNPENAFGLDGQVRRRIAATLNESREQLARAFYNTTKDCYRIDRSLAAAMNLLNTGKKFAQRVQPTAAAYGQSTISQIAAARREAKAAATLAAAAAAQAQTESALAQAAKVESVDTTAATDTGGAAAGTSSLETAK